MRPLIKNIPFYCKLAGKHVLLLLGIFELCRVLFFAYNHTYFSDVTLGKFFYYLFIGLRFDIVAIITTNLPYLVLFILPFGSMNSIYRRYILKSIFILVNGFALLSQLVDTVFLKFEDKRSTFDIFKFLSLGSDTTNLMPFILKEYWYMLLVLMISLSIMIYAYNKINKQALKELPDDHHYIAASLSSYIIASGLLILGFRGGWQLKPISIIDAADYAPVHDIPLVINTPFSIEKTMDAPPLKEYHFFPEKELPNLFQTTHSGSASTIRKLNVVTIILESFSKEYIGSLNNRHGSSNTPFLDSLMAQSLLFDNAFSDGKRSIDGIPAVVASLPSWSDEPYITSNYGIDNVPSLANLLGKIGYTSAFFHGGTNGTMGFEAFSYATGFKHYFGRSQYNNDKDYDQHWGIWDEPFFRYFAANLDTMRQPFYAAIFSVTSHHPFDIPDKYKNVFVQKQNEQPILKCIRYTDMVLKEFFENVSHKPWFDSTLFVITADHTGPSDDPYFANRIGMYEIPIAFYMHNSSLKGRSHLVMQQIDIMPSVLDYLHYPYPYFAFGKSVFDNNNNNRIAVNYLNDVFEIVKSPYCLLMNDSTVSSLYNYQQDSMLTHNLLKEKPVIKDSLATTLKAILQTYCSDIIHNNMQIKKEEHPVLPLSSK